MFEHHRQPLLPRHRFAGRVLRYTGIALLMLGDALLVGIIGFQLFAGMDWYDALLNASMLLGGMGPVFSPDTPLSNGAKVFASLYALFAGVVFLLAFAVILSPLAHRLMHRFHLNLPDR